VSYDDQGRAWPNVGHLEEAAVTLHSSRDLVGIDTQIIDDGETAIDGVVVRYISPEHGYTLQPSAPWVNTAHYDGISEPNFLMLDVQGCQNHNQGVRLAKAVGLRSASPLRAGLNTTIKGILAKGRRNVNLHHDEDFDGFFEVITPVNEDAQGMFCSMAVVPMQADRYFLNPSEEGAPPAVPDPLNISNALALPANVTLTTETVTGSMGNNERIRATFDAPVRVDRFFRFRYAPTGQTTYEYFTVDMDALSAHSAIVNNGTTYDVSWQTVTGGGRASDWSTAVQHPDPGP